MFQNSKSYLERGPSTLLLADCHDLLPYIRTKLSMIFGFSRGRDEQEQARKRRSLLR